MPATVTDTVLSPINIKQWVEDHIDEFKPPVSNKYLYLGKDFFVMVIGGPNARNDFHKTESEEYFYQFKGDIFRKPFNGQDLLDAISSALSAGTKE